ncbi:MAG: MOSC domain-containing protein [Candidatus Omnitrophica bacterium]|nr:MOSC domain-containing protein [Candidatus Omnitrophota bacterium]
MDGRIYSIHLSEMKGSSCVEVKQAKVVRNFGLESDIRAGDTVKQVSLHSIEGIRRQRKCARIGETKKNLVPGDFSENITTIDMDLTSLKLHDKLKINSKVVLEISKIGKECYEYCPREASKNHCVIPKEAIFVKALTSGTISTGDTIEVMKDV